MCILLLFHAYFIVFHREANGASSTGKKSLKFSNIFRRYVELEPIGISGEALEIFLLVFTRKNMSNLGNISTPTFCNDFSQFMFFFYLFPICFLPIGVSISLQTFAKKKKITKRSCFRNFWRHFQHESNQNLLEIIR